MAKRERRMTMKIPVSRETVAAIKKVPATRPPPTAPELKPMTAIPIHLTAESYDVGGNEHEAQSVDTRDIHLASVRSDMAAQKALSEKYATELRHVREEMRSWWIGERASVQIKRIDEVLGENA